MSYPSAEASAQLWRLEQLCSAQTWGVLEARAGSLARARELFQQGVWAQPGSCNVSRVWQVAPCACASFHPVYSAIRTYQCRHG